MNASTTTLPRHFLTLSDFSAEQLRAALDPHDAFLHDGDRRLADAHEADFGAGQQ